MTIIEPNYKWAHTLAKRRETKYLILHHAAGSGISAEEIHEMQLREHPGWAGIAYHYYVRKSGAVYRGRPEDTQGAHTLNHNYNSIGICFEGNFETDTMFAQQFAAGKALIRDILTRYPDIEIKGHKDFNATACPGKKFPLAEYQRVKAEGGEEEVDIEKLLSEMTDEQAWKLVEKANKHAATMRPSTYATEACLKGITSGLFSDGNKDGLVDSPQSYVKRQELATVLYRAGLMDK